MGRGARVRWLNRPSRLLGPVVDATQRAIQRLTDRSRPDEGSLVIDLALVQEIFEASPTELERLREAHPEILTTAFANDLLEAEQHLARHQLGDNFWELTYVRLRLDSLRMGRNLDESMDALWNTTSLRVVRDQLISEPLLLHPVFSRFFGKAERQSRQQGREDDALRFAMIRNLFADAAHRGVDPAYFNLLVRQLTEVSSSETARVENADLLEKFKEWTQAEIWIALRMGDQDRIRRLRMAKRSLEPHSVRKPVGGDAAALERRSRLMHLVLGSDDPAEWRPQLEEEPDLLAGGSARDVAAANVSGLLRASVDHDVLAARDHWRRRGLLLRAAEAGVSTAFDEWEEGDWWPTLLATL